jgi:hypothetical protein
MFLNCSEIFSLFVVVYKYLLERKGFEVIRIVFNRQIKLQ